MVNRFNAAAVLLLCASALGVAPPDAAKQWGQWRGPMANGVAERADPPVTWSETDNIRWKVRVPGHGLSTPIVWGDVVYLQTAMPSDPAHRGRTRREPVPPGEPYQFVVLALDRATGRTLWQKTVHEEVPKEGSHRDGSLAPASPTTDGEHLYAFFGSRGLYCLTMTGETVWEKHLGTMTTRNGFGEGSSPVLFGDTLVINWDHEGDSFIVALDKRTGVELWRRDRDEVTSWSTPLIINDAGKPRVVVSATKRVRAYDLATGKTIWEVAGLGVNCAPSPVASSEFVFAMSGYHDANLLAIRYAGAKGDLTGSDAVAWSTTKGTSYVPSPLLYRDTLYYLRKNAGILSCVDAKTGRPHYAQQRLDEIGGVYASPVAADGRVYVVGRGGTTYVLKHGKSFEVLAINKLKDRFSASPAIAGGDIYLRGEKNLYCIGRK